MKDVGTNVEQEVVERKLPLRPRQTCSHLRPNLNFIMAQQRAKAARRRATVEKSLAKASQSPKSSHVRNEVQNITAGSRVSGRGLDETAELEYNL